MVLSALIMPFAHELASALINEPDVIRYTVIFIYILGAAQPLMGIEFSLSGCLRGAGHPIPTTYDHGGPNWRSGRACGLVHEYVSISHLDICSTAG